MECVEIQSTMQMNIENAVENAVVSESHVYSQSPYVATYDNYLTDEECQHFINISRYIFLNDLFFL